MLLVIRNIRVRRAVGHCLIAAPFVGIAVFTVVTMGVLPTLFVFVLAGAIFGCVGLGVDLTR